MHWLPKHRLSFTVVQTPEFMKNSSRLFPSTRSRSRSRLAALTSAAAFLTLGVPHGAEAQSSWITNPANGLTTDAANWSGNVAPTSGNSWTFANSTIDAVTNGFNGYNVGGLVFASNSASYTLSGNAFTLTGGITKNGPATITISNALTLGGGITVSAASGRLNLNGPISGSGSLVKSGTGTLWLGANNTFEGGITLNEGALRTAVNSTVSSGTVTGGSLGTGTLTVNGGRIMPGGAGAIYVPTLLVNSNFAVNAGIYNGTDNGRASFAGVMNLAGGTRTIALGRWTNASGALVGGQESWRFISNNALAATITNGSVRFTREDSGSPTNYAAVNFSAGMVIASDASIIIASNILTTFATADPWSTTAPPAVAVDPSGIFNLSTDTNARSPRIRTLSGAGLVTSLANAASSTTSTLTISNLNSTDNATFSGSILTGALLNGTLGTSATNVALALVKAGDGTQVLSGSNSYTGSTTISGGTLQIGNGSTSGNLGSGSLVNNGTLAFNRSDNIAQGTDFTTNGISGTGRLVKAGAGTLTLNVQNSFSGGLAIEGGAVSVNAENRLGAAPSSFSADAIVLSNGGKISATTGFSFNANRGITLGAGGGGIHVSSGQTLINPSGQLIAGSGTLTKSGPGTLTLSAPSTFSGGLLLNEGFVRLQASSILSGSDIISGAVGVGNITVNGGGILGGGGQTLNATNLTINSDFAINSGTSGLNGRLSLGAGLIDLTGNTRTISIGRLGTAAATLQGGLESLRFISNASYFVPTITNGTMRFVRDASGTDSEFASVNFGVVGIRFSGDSGFTVGTNIITTFAPGNAFTNASGDLPHVATEAGGIFNLGTTNGVNSQTIRSLSGAAGYVTTLATLASSATATLTISNQAGDYQVYGGRIVTGSELNATLGTTATNAVFALTKRGAGTQVLNGLNTYTGNTTVAAGLLELGPAGSLRFVVGPAGTNNAVTGTGEALFRGTFVIDLTGASTNLGDSWTLVSTSVRGYDGSFQVAGFTNNGGTWFRQENGVTYGFATSNSVLAVVNPPQPANPYDSWLTNYPTLQGSDALPASDPDGDGYANSMEFAFGGNPTVGTPALLSASRVGTNAVFSFIADTNSVTYSAQKTTNLATGPWEAFAPTNLAVSTNQSGVLLSNYTRLQFSEPAAGRSFFRVQGTVNTAP